MSKKTKAKKDGALPLPIFVIVAAALLFGIYLSLSTLTLTFWGEETLGTVDGYTVEVDDSDSLAGGFQVTQSYFFTVNGEEYRGRTVFNTHSPQVGLDAGQTRTESITYLPLAPRVNKPTALAGFSELGFLGVLRHIVLPVMGAALLVYLFRWQIRARAKTRTLSHALPPSTPPKTSSPTVTTRAEDSGFPTLTGAARFASTLCSKWTFAHTAETHDVYSLLLLAQVYEENAPADEGCFYIVSNVGAIGIACGDEQPDWLFLPVHPPTPSHP